MKKISKINFWMIMASIAAALVTGLLFIVVDGLFSSFKLLMLGAFTVLVFVPFFVELIFKKKFPSYIVVCYICFIWISTLLGSIYGLYELISFYDIIVHFISGALLALLGLYILELAKVKPNLFVTILFVISFAVLCGVFWEIWEFVTDIAFNLNSQRHSLADGTPKVGQDALFNTMLDIIADLSGSLVASVTVIIMRSRRNNAS